MQHLSLKEGFDRPHKCVPTGQIGRGGPLRGHTSPLWGRGKPTQRVATGRRAGQQHRRSAAAVRWTGSAAIGAWGVHTRGRGASSAAGRRRLGRQGRCGAVVSSSLLCGLMVPPRGREKPTHESQATAASPHRPTRYVDSWCPYGGTAGPRICAASPRRNRGSGRLQPDGQRVGRSLCHVFQRTGTFSQRSVCSWDWPSTGRPGVCAESVAVSKKWSSD